MSSKSTGSQLGVWAMGTPRQACLSFKKLGITYLNWYGFMYSSSLNLFTSCFTLLDGYRNISNQYGITTKIDKEHPGMREYAQNKGWWDGKKQFSFAQVYSFLTTARIEAAGSRYCEGKKLLAKSNGQSQCSTSVYTSSSRPEVY